MNYVLMGITCVVFVYIVHRMGKSHTKSAMMISPIITDLTLVQAPSDLNADD